MLLFIHSLQVDCFGMNTTAEYDTQRETIKFTAIPSQSLTGESKKLCSDVINNQDYQIYLQVGSSIFQSNILTYNSSKKIFTELSCQNGSKCELVDIEDVTAVRYILYFMNLDFNLSSIVNEYDIITYDHTDCLRDVEMVYDTISTRIIALFVGRPKHCPNNGTGTNIILREYVNGELKVNSQFPLALYPIAFPNSGITLATPITKFWESVTKLGPLTANLVPGLKDMINEGLQNFFNQVKVDLVVPTTIIQQNINGSNFSLSFQQSISFYILRKRNDVQDDCFSNVQLIIQRRSITILADKNLMATKCSNDFITAQGFTFDTVKFLLVAAQNEDYSGFIFDGLYEVPGYQLGASVRHTIQCHTDTECTSFARILELQQLQGNISLILEHAYMLGNTFSLRSQYIPEISEALYQEVDVKIRSDSVCITFIPLSVQIYDIAVKIDAFNFHLSIYGALNQQKYCQGFKNLNNKLLMHLLNVMKEKQIDANNIHITIDSQDVTTVTATIYYIPEEKMTVWYLVIAYAILIVGLIIGIVFFNFNMESMLISQYEPE